eukprot:4201735-Pleurochrysis_carterae.AAC.1
MQALYDRSFQTTQYTVPLTLHTRGRCRTAVPLERSATPAINPLKFLVDPPGAMFQCKLPTPPLNAGVLPATTSARRQHIPRPLDPRDPHFEKLSIFDKGNYYPGRAKIIS